MRQIKLYPHQKDIIDAIKSGALNDFKLSTPMGRSGKRGPYKVKESHVKANDNFKGVVKCVTFSKS